MWTNVLTGFFFICKLIGLIALIVGVVELFRSREKEDEKEHNRAYVLIAIGGWLILPGNFWNILGLHKAGNLIFQIILMVAMIAFTAYVMRLFTDVGSPDTSQTEDADNTIG